MDVKRDMVGAMEIDAGDTQPNSQEEMLESTARNATLQTAEPAAKNKRVELLSHQN